MKLTSHASLAPLQHRLLQGNPAAMTPVFDLDDRARLGERFFGARHAVLAQR
ncbi:hypothetical protein ACFSUD_15810 [Sulfitobacter aestuarii]|uniref:Uncharacterized protein n=1 Tax=Sulfitobacter aestuarii TaxID=2161676 RepID=A0ABW5U604_9RHOB